MPLVSASNISYQPLQYTEWWKSHVQYVKFRRQGIDIIGAKFEHSSSRTVKANVIVLTGWSETFLKYDEMIKMLYERDYNVYTYDHQSQGISGRWLSERQSSYVASFDDYVDDFTYFITCISELNTNNLPLYVVASSMGGLICAIAMSKLPNIITRSVLLAPMLRNKCSMKYFNYRFPLPQPLAYWLANLSCNLGLSKYHTFGFFLDNPNDPLPSNTFTSNDEQLELYQKLRQQYPAIISSCVTNNWLLQSIKAQRKFESRYQYVFTNTLIIAAQNDYFVYNRAISQFAQNAPACKVFYAPGSYHEVWAEKDHIRGSVLTAISDFFSQKYDDVMPIEPRTPLVVYDHTAPTYSVAEATFRSCGILIAALGVFYGVSIVFGDGKRK